MVDQPLPVEQLHDELRRAILDRMRQGKDRREHRDSFNIINPDRLHELLPDREIPERNEDRMKALVWQIFHELYLERIIVPGTGSLRSDPHMWSRYCITDHGQQVLQIREYSPYDPEGYLARLRSDISNVDETIVRYVEESLQCLRMDCLLAAAVTIGCAAEKAMLLLIEKFGLAISDSGKKQQYEKETRDWRISPKYKAFRNHFEGIAEKLPKELRRPWESHLDGAFNLIRQVRNTAGHPSGDPVTRETIIANHTTFPGYCKYVYSLMDHFAKHGVDL